MTDALQKFAKRLIQLHGFRSNDDIGFSCFIPDRYPSNHEGLFLWNYSKSYRRFETQIQKFHAMPRIYRMEEMLGLSEYDYKWTIIEAVEGYLNLLMGIGCFGKIGNGIDLFNVKRTDNIEANFELLIKDPSYLREIEKITIDNPIVQFAEDQDYFAIQNKDVLAWDEFYS